MGKVTELATYFDTPLRSSEQEIERHKNNIFKNSLIIQILEGLPNIAVILDKNRQIVAFNKNAEQILKNAKNGKIYGNRIGEAIGCIHSTEMPAGCGTSKFCSECGAGRCNKLTREFLKSCSEECRITINTNNLESSLDLKVYTSVLNIEEETYTLFSIEDIQDEKRRKVLEKIFFHDVLNTASSIKGIAEILPDITDKDEFREFNEHLDNSSEQLLREIQTQRDLVNAEQGNLAVNIKHVSVNEILSRAYNLYKNTDLSRNKNYYFESLDTDIFIDTDIVLLVRSLGNLIKNALEATVKSGNVKLKVEAKKDAVLFLINNDSVIPGKYQLQIFQRSFSTKAESGRGIGTYSVKLLVEQYLKGEVSFTSNIKDGTTFYLSIPINF